MEERRLPGVWESPVLCMLGAIFFTYEEMGKHELEGNRYKLLLPDLILSWYKEGRLLMPAQLL